MKFLEKILISLVFISIIAKYMFSYGAAMDVIIFSGVLLILYFPLGFYFINTPSQMSSIFLAVILGLAYSTGLLPILFGVFNLYGYTYIVELFAIIQLLTLFFLILRYNAYGKDFKQVQFIRISFLVITNLIIFFK